jgi:hypothetical protein
MGWNRVFPVYGKSETVTKIGMLGGMLRKCQHFFLRVCFFPETGGGALRTT